MTEESSQRQVLSISQLNRRARLLLETNLQMLWVRGEISNFANPGSGHWYFTLKDADAQVRCAMFRNRNTRAGLRPRNGDQVLVRARVGLYEARGEYQLVIEHLEADGAGLLQQRFDALKARLQEEGLFDAAAKRSLPPFPTRVGIVTSPTGAAVRDVLHVMKRRCPWVEVSIFPTAVQGQEAVPQLVRAIEFANQAGNCDLLLLTRGGGSLEDLWAFNEEAVARAIFASDLPVVSAVGHETDFTIADFVADLRAPTPSAAAEMISPDGEALGQRLAQYERRLDRQITGCIAQLRLALVNCGKRLRSPVDKLREQAQQLDHLEIRLLQAWGRGVAQRQGRLQLLLQRLHTTHPEKQLNVYQQSLLSLNRRLQRTTVTILAGKGQQLQALAATLNAVSPLNTLDRGYAIALNKQREVIRSVAEVNREEEISIRLRDGLVHCEVRGAEELDAEVTDPE